MTALPDIRTIACVMGGKVFGRKALVPGPGHSPRDGSLSISLSATDPDGFIVYSFAGDDWRECRDYVCDKLGIPRWRPSPDRSGRTFRRERRARSSDGLNDENRRIEFALRLWEEARDPRGTLVVNYLRGRKLCLTDEHSGSVIRFHPELKLSGARVGGMLCLIRDIRTNSPCGIHRTFLDSIGRKLDRKMLGRARAGAIKLDADETVTLGLNIGEGVETSLAAWLAGLRPVWALGSATAIATFPVLSGIDAVTVLGETDDNGANERAVQSCAARWKGAEREALIATPIVGGDFNDAWMEAVS
jgi:putative DNA primase/helicase